MPFMFMPEPRKHLDVRSWETYPGRLAVRALVVWAKDLEIEGVYGPSLPKPEQKDIDELKLRMWQTLIQYPKNYSVVTIHRSENLALPPFLGDLFILKCTKDSTISGVGLKPGMMIRVDNRGQTPTTGSFYSLCCMHSPIPFDISGSSAQPGPSAQSF